MADCADYPVPNRTERKIATAVAGRLDGNVEQGEDVASLATPCKELLALRPEGGVMPDFANTVTLLSPRATTRRSCLRRLLSSGGW